MEEADNVVYGENDLAGLKVAHDTDQFEEGEDVILTLKDSRILEGDEDELQNVNIADDEAVQAAKDRKRKANEAYTGYDDDEFDEKRIGEKAEVLAKYDDEFSGGKVEVEGFRLGAPAPKKKAKVVADEDNLMVGVGPATKVKLNLDFAKDFEVSDYMKEGDVGFKKPKKRRAKKSTRRAEADDADDTAAMDVDPSPTFTRRVVGEDPDNLVDDDDLQAALARSRREHAKKKPRVKPEDLAARIHQQQRQEDDAAQVKDEDEAGGDDDGRITFDETSEFVRNVTAESRIAVPIKRERSGTGTPAPAAASGSTDEAVVVKVERVDDGDAEMDSDSEDEDDELANLAAREGLSLAEYRLRIDAQMTELDSLKAEDVDAAANPDPEPTNTQGMAGVLAMLRNQGSLQKRTAADDARERSQKQHDLWLADHKRRAAQRELDRIAARGGNKDQAQREYENRVREQTDARDALESFKNYQPDVEIVYHDEFGRKMTPKEAWKSLSHKFHGKTSGRMKTEKRMRKIEEERKAAYMAAGDTPTGMTDAFARRQQKTGEAHMVLSVGNKGSVTTDKGKGRR